MSPVILVVDDERDLVSTIEYNLEREGFEIRTAFDGRTALLRARQSPLPDLVLLDLMLPDFSGTEVCRRLKEDPVTKHIPVLMLTAKAEEIDRVVGFELGADDYVAKPYSVRELNLRVKAILRRTHSVGTSESPTAFGRIRLDRAGHRVWLDDAEVTLTAIEFRLLDTMLTRKGRVQSRKQLLDDVWGIQADVTTRTVDTHVKRLRQKLGEAGNYIETLRGVGYRFRSSPEEGVA
ncbi:MAG: winged helix-turn-helix domain-containing protein [Deltaproteobacteria bacterium]|nr:winged helix-turn-helix domain-containing protein [Deltaproteobacteria bacterium]